VIKSVERGANSRARFSCGKRKGNPFKRVGVSGILEDSFAQETHFLLSADNARGFLSEILIKK